MVELPHLEVHGVDGPGLAGDVSVTGPGVSQKHVTKLLTSLTHNNNPGDRVAMTLMIRAVLNSPLVVAGPGQVLDGSGDGLELVLQDVLLVNGVPDPHLAALVSTGDVEPTGTVFCYIHLETFAYYLFFSSIEMSLTWQLC